MTRLWRVRRRPDHWATPHDRARHRAAERLDGPLGVIEAAWLEEHLAECGACFATAQAFEVDRMGLRSLRDDIPVPPRDLWARTSAAIEQESAGHRRASTGAAGRSPLAQWGAIAGVVVVAVVVGSSLLQGGWLGRAGGTAVGPQGSLTALLTPQPLPSGIEVTPGATPMVVDAGDVGWFDVGADGSYAYNVANVDKVCAQVDQASCAALDAGHGRPLALSTSPKSIITSPANGQTVVVGADGSGGNAVFVVALPEDQAASPSPTAGADSPPPSPTAVPTATVATASASPSASAPAVATTAGPSISSSPSPVASPSADPSSPPPSDPPSPTPTSDTTPTPTMTPAPTAEALAIVSGVTVVGDAAAFSPDGEWFAFTARPADGSAGPDIYVWHVGEPHAHAMTTDHQSAFGSWADGLVIGSRPGLPSTTAASSPGETAGASPTPDLQPVADVGPVTFSLDPSTGTELVLPVAWWRPAVSPTGRRAVVWDGSVRVDSAGRTIAPTDGRLVLVDWGVNDTAPTAPRVVSKDPISDFTVRWDETGSWLAVWLADAGDPMIGRLSLLHLDPATGKVDRPAAGPQDVPAMPGFSIENGRLAWASPPRQDGEGSHVQIVAWSVDGVGSIESAPGQDVVVVR